MTDLSGMEMFVALGESEGLSHSGRALGRECRGSEPGCRTSVSDVVPSTVPSDLLGHLPVVTVATDDEALAFLQRRKLMGRGTGFVDVQLLAPGRLSGAGIWRNDKRLASVAEELELSPNR